MWTRGNQESERNFFMKLTLLAGLVCSALVSTGFAASDDTISTAPWTAEKANEWYAKQPWLVGANFAPATAINQLEMWNADTFDPERIDKELGWGASIGFNTMRVFLHDIPWKEDKEGFLKRIEKFLEIADKHNIKIMFVLFDGVWDPFPTSGKQREPKPHVHNSGWVQSPGYHILKDPKKQDELKDYVVGIISHFRDDKRVIIWDLFNEPDNPVSQYKNVELKNKREAATELLIKSYVWAREVNPSQPLTSGVWIGNWPNPDKLSITEKVQIEYSDVISFHNYGSLDNIKKCVDNLTRYNRPMLCTEYMARPLKSTFDPVMGYLKEKKVGAYNWGFVEGKSQTNYPWDSWEKIYTEEAKPWFHDIFRTDGTPYDTKETNYIKSLTGKAPAKTKDAEAKSAEVKEAVKK